MKPIARIAWLLMLATYLVICLIQWPLLVVATRAIDGYSWRLSNRAAWQRWREILKDGQAIFA